MNPIERPRTEAEVRAAERAIRATEAATQAAVDATPFGHPDANVPPPGPVILGQRYRVADIHAEARGDRLAGRESK